MAPRRRKRLDPAVFGLPAELLSRGFYADASVTRAREIVAAHARANKVVLQVTSKGDGWLGGIDETIAILKAVVPDWNALVVHALYEGDRFDSWDTVLTIEGPYETFASTVVPCLGVLSRRTRVCTNAKAIALAAASKPVLMLGAANDVFGSQAGDGFAAMIGGVKLFSTEAQASLFNGKTMTVVSRELIAALGGDTVKATKRFCDGLEGVDVVAHVDYDNDCTRTSVDVARSLEGRLWGVRLDTPSTMVDKSIVSQMGSFSPAGVNPQLVWNVRNALDAEGFGEVKIVASGGMDAARIAAYEEDGVPVDVYGVGRAFFDGRFDFAADVVNVNGKPQARAGRSARENSRMERVK